MVSDLNLNGRLDLVVANDGSNNISVLLGNGNGAFQAQVTYPVVGGPFSIASGDFNRDGMPDLAVTTQNNSKVNVLLGSGNGAFLAATSYTAGASPYSVAVSDLNDDGQPDLVVANAGSSSVSVLLGNGLGIYPNQAQYAVGGLPKAIGTDDFNEDGYPDLATANSASDSLSILIGNGDGTFQTRVNYPVTRAGGSYNPVSLAVADLNGDQHLDLATAGYGGSSVGVLFGNGNGTFQAGQTIFSEYLPNAVAISDLNQDGKADLIEASGVPGVIIRLGNGDGTFQTEIPYETGSGTFPMFVTTSDLNHDGILDLVTANYDLGTVSVLLGAGGGYFYPYTQYTVDLMPLHVTVNDFNRDGNADLATANTGGSVSVLLGKGDGTFQPQVSYLTGQPTVELAAGDFNRDGKTDLAVSTNTHLSILQGDGSGSFANPVTYPVVTSITTVGDFNLDGKPDLALSDTSLSILLNQASPLQEIHSLGSGPWSSSDTWQCRVPTRYDTVTINSGDTVTLDSAGAALSLTTAGALTVSGSNPLAVSGDWTLTGSFSPGSGTVTFDGGGTQTLAGDTLFHNLVIGSHSILTTSSTVSLTGTLTNLGWTRETRPISGAESVSYNLGEMSLDISNPGTLTSLQVTRRDTNYPGNTPAELQSGRYWSLTPNAGAAGFNISLTLPVSPPTTPSYKVCRYAGPGWDCSQSSRTATSVTREGITQFSDWTVLRLVDTQMELRLDKTSTTYGDPVTLTATLTASSGVPTGMVAFYDGATLLGTGILDGNGQATFSTSALGAGTHDLTAQYAGEGAFASSSDTLTGGLVVSKATPTVTFNLESAPVTYDGAPHPVSLEIAASSVPGSVSNIQYNGLVTPPTNAGNIAITADFIPTDTENYRTLTGLSVGIFVFQKASLTVTADNQSKIFGANTPFPPLTYTITGFVNGEENMHFVSGEPLLATTAAANSPVGVYLSTITQNSDPLKKLTTANYTFTFVNGKLTITGETLFLPVILAP